MNRLLTALVAGAAVSTLAYASASALLVNGGTVQVGADGVTCDTDGIKVNYGYDDKDDLIHYVRIQGITDACVGADLGGMFDGNTATRFGFRTITQNDVDADGGRFDFLGTKPNAGSVENVKVWIEG